MSKRNSYILGIIATLVIGSYFYSKYCCADCHKNDKNHPKTALKVEEKQIQSKAFQISGHGFDYSCGKNFNFLKNDFNVIEPVDKDIIIGINKLKAYFDKNTNGRLVITGYALKSEKNTSAFPNLGFARANDVKNYFTTKGLDPNRFELTGKFANRLDNEDEMVLGPVHFLISNNQLAAKAQDWDSKKEKYNDDPLQLHFNTNQSEILLTTNERQHIADLSEYLDNNPEATLECTGYTDNSGDRYVNLELGQERADFAKKYLIRNGIPENRIKTFSKGPDEPIANNLTPEGKASNRRTVIILK